MKSSSFIEAHTDTLENAGHHQSRHLLRQLIAHRLNVSVAQLLAYPERDIPDSVQLQLNLDIKQLLEGTPVAYVFGEVPFLDWDFAVDHNVLIPRPETEALAAMLIKTCKKPPSRILDLCCGSGVLGLSLALQFERAQVCLTDICAEALAVTKKNILRHGLEDRTDCYRGDLWQALPSTSSQFDWIVANPPYVAPQDDVAADVLDFEPAKALYSDSDGMAHIQAILTQIDDHLVPDGRAAFELGHYHHQTLLPFLENREFRGRFHWEKDPFGVARYLFYDGPAKGGQD